MFSHRSIIGSGIGGCLAEPVKNYPGTFAKGTIWDRFPFLLPNVICTIVVICGLVFGILFLEETHEKAKLRRDYGRELGAWLVAKATGSGPARNMDRDMDHGHTEVAEGMSLMREQELDFDHQDTASTCSTSGSTPTLGPQRRASLPTMDTLSDEMTSEKPEKSVASAFSRRVMYLILAYGILAL